MTHFSPFALVMRWLQAWLIRIYIQGDLNEIRLYLDGW